MGLLPASLDPSLLPPVLLFSLPVLYISYRLFSGSSSSKSKAYDPSTGIGRGAPGFQTGVKRVAIPPALAARIRAGEEVSAEEVTAALEAEKERLAREEAGEKEKKKLPANVDADWLPASATKDDGKGKCRKRR
ncbi:hypothetical protein JCM8097_006663 [Rhodosporidiobolus ruineniae]